MKTSKCVQCDKQLTYIGSRPKKWCSASCRSLYRYENDIKYQQRNTYVEQTIRSKERKLKAIKLKGGCCSKCDQKHPAALCFHHVDPSVKSFNVDSRVFGNTKWEKIEKELDKCVLLCLNCHQILHYNEYWSTL